MEEPPPTELDWSNLQADILITVLCKLEFPDFFRSAAVCTTWLAAAHALRRLGLYNRPQTPCLLYTNAAGSPRVAELFSLADKSTYKMHLPDPPIRKRRIIGSSHGWLVTADSRSELHLLNPATGEQISLPPVATMEHVSPVFDHTGRLQRYDLSFYDATLPRKEYDRQPYLPGEFRDVLYRKVVLSCDPSRRGCIAMMIHNPRRQLSFARVVGDSKWHWVATSLHGSNYSDCIFHDGAFYAMNLQGGIHRYTIAGRRTVAVGTPSTTTYATQSGIRVNPEAKQITLHFRIQTRYLKIFIRPKNNSTLPPETRMALVSRYTH
ncbi:hypothetical protein ACQ4PT_030076 [Festuca glaucescens]